MCTRCDWGKTNDLIKLIGISKIIKIQSANDINTQAQIEINQTELYLHILTFSGNSKI